MRGAWSRISRSNGVIVELDLETDDRIYEAHNIMMHRAVLGFRDVSDCRVLSFSTSFFFCLSALLLLLLSDGSRQMFCCDITWNRV